MYCKYCDTDKPESFFKTHSRKCVQCQTRKTNEWRGEHPDRYKHNRKVWLLKNAEHLKQYNRKRYHSGNYKRSPNVRLTSRLWKMRNREKVRAKGRVEYAIKKGILTRPKVCSICGGGPYIIAHHDDYSKPLQVRWVCCSCHRRIHEGSLTGPVLNT